uniref:Uncharacterized protein n=1 Tax=Glossina pallidipes TaxID=7398 RepID=A0A1B0A0S4_GLOPL
MYELLIRVVWPASYLSHLTSMLIRFQVLKINLLYLLTHLRVCGCLTAISWNYIEQQRKTFTGKAPEHGNGKAPLIKHAFNKFMIALKIFACAIVHAFAFHTVDVFKGFRNILKNNI